MTQTMYKHSNLTEEISETDEEIFKKITSTVLSDDQIQKIIQPELIVPNVQSVLAIHWHPEYIPMELIQKRIETMFPHKTNELIIPTQHNVLMEYGKYSGVEVDCYSHGFDQKVQLLLHFETSKIKDAVVLKNMLQHTFKYRSSQLFDYIYTITKPIEHRIQQAVSETAVDQDIIHFVRIYVKKIETLVNNHADHLPDEMIKNKLIRNFFNELQPIYGEAYIRRCQSFLNSVKKIVKQNFSLQYFYRTTEIIEETRSLGGCIVVPHPEQFWPILLADYDIDGYEVWNPQSQRYTRFIISVLHRTNRYIRKSNHKILVFMGDDTHMGEKILIATEENKEKMNREIGVQAWNDMLIQKELSIGNITVDNVIEEYKHRLSAA
ncbi:MAG: hypothetical protein HQK77_14490 [Desulfobacterales bacterium]|nr:hypothetical protein [Desulfobacterales bacterium]